MTCRGRRSTAAARARSGPHRVGVRALARHPGRLPVAPRPLGSRDDGAAPRPQQRPRRVRPRGLDDLWRRRVWAGYPPRARPGRRLRPLRRRSGGCRPLRGDDGRPPFVPRSARTSGMRSWRSATCACSRTRRSTSPVVSSTPGTDGLSSLTTDIRGRRTRTAWVTPLALCLAPDLLGGGPHVLLDGAGRLRRPLSDLLGALLRGRLHVLHDLLAGGLQLVLEGLRLVPERAGEPLLGLARRDQRRPAGRPRRPPSRPPGLPCVC